MIYVVSPNGKQNYDDKNNFLNDVIKSAININKLISVYNQNEDKKLEVVRITLFSGGNYRHESASKVDVAKAIILGLSKDPVSNITYEFSYDSNNSFNKAYNELQNIQTGGNIDYRKKYIKYKIMYSKLKKNVMI
jgi:hypothetical protein